jgi:small basic protein (TIGR04137 family)
MSIDRSLKVTSGLSSHRNVLTRAERVEKLLGQGKFDQQTGDPLGLPKVGNRKTTLGKKAKKRGPEGEEEAAE